MTIWLHKLQDLKHSAYRSFAEAVSRAIETGASRTGPRQPRHRKGDSLTNPG